MIILEFYKDLKVFVEIKVRSGSRRKNNTRLRKVKTNIGTQWKIGFTQCSLHMHAYICGDTFLCKIVFLMYSLPPHEIWICFSNHSVFLTFLRGNIFQTLWKSVHFESWIQNVWLSIISTGVEWHLFKDFHS